MKNNYVLLALLAFVAYKFLKPKPTDKMDLPVSPVNQDRMPESTGV